MPTFQLTGPDGANYSVTAPDEQSALSAFSSFHGGGAQQPAQPAPDKYQQAAKADVDKADKAGLADTGYTRRLVHGATMGADNMILAGLQAIPEAIRHGNGSDLLSGDVAKNFNAIKEGYNYAKAREDEQLNRSRANTGVIGTGAELLGGAATGGALSSGATGLVGNGASVLGRGATLARDAAGNAIARSGPQVTLGRYLAPNAGVIARTAAGAGDAAALGGVSGFNEGNGLTDSLASAGKGAVAGGLLGGALPFAGAVLHGVSAPIFANLKARYNPEGFATGQVARAVHESGLTPAEIEQRVQQAAQEGQPQFNVADAMGNAGQEMLGTAARGPGAARTQIVNTLDNRQAEQGRRIANALDEGFGTNGETAAQAEQRLTQARDTRADSDFGNVRSGAGRVDVVPAINNLDRNIGTGGGQNMPTANDSVESALQPFRERLARVNPDDFEAVQRIRGDMADAANNARQSGYGNRARLIGQAVRELDASMEAASPGYRAANANFAQGSRNIQAVGTGRTAATRGRSEDTIRAFNAMTPEEQQASRIGYADKNIADVQGPASGVNKARNFTGDAFQDEAATMAPGNDLMQRRLGRENTMFQTRATATGGSSTAKNLAHDEAAGMDPALAMHVITGNVHGALGHVLAAGKNGWTGNTPAVRQAVANMLLKNGANLAPGELAQAVNRTIARMQSLQNWGRVARAARNGVPIAATQEMTAPTPPERLRIGPAN